MAQSQDPNQFGSSNFDGDGKGGDYSGNYNTGSNPVSQVFKGGGLLSDSRTRLMILSGILILVAGGAFLLLSDDSEYDDPFANGDDLAMESDDFGDEFGKDNKSDKDAALAKEEDSKTELDDSAKEEDDGLGLEEDEGDDDLGLSEEDEGLEDSADEIGLSDDTPAVTSASTKSYSSGTVYAPKAVSPENGMKKYYDESRFPAHFEWQGSGGWISFARTPDMSNVIHKFRVRNNNFKYKKLLPGIWYWQISNRSGKTEVRTIEILPPKKRQVSLVVPGEGGMINGNGGVVSWTGDTKVAYYRVEISNNDFSQPGYRFATAGTQVEIKEVPTGDYQMRLGAFSEVSGRWEYTSPIKVNVQ